MQKFRYFVGLSAAAYLLASSVQICAQEPVPPPVEQSTADCARPVYASDQLVCSDRALRVLDERLRLLLDQGPSPAAAIMQESGEQWFKRRSLCAFQVEHQRCLAEAYTNRLAVIETASSDKGPGQIATCKKLEKIGRITMHTAANGNIVLKDFANNGLIGIATPKSDDALWKPTLSYSKQGKLYHFQPAERSHFSCRLK
jgi:uncharacterized protein